MMAKMRVAMRKFQIFRIKLAMGFWLVVQYSIALAIVSLQLIFLAGTLGFI